jgi:hypothetical protein
MVDLRFPNQDLRNEDYKDVEAGDETHRYGDYIPYPHGTSGGEPDTEIGDLVTIDGGNLAKFSSSDGDVLLGVHYTSKYLDGAAGGPDRDRTVDTDAPATVKTAGTAVVRLEDGQFATDVSTDVSVGQTLGANGGGLVLREPQQDPDDSSVYYTEVLF